jgi:hypothetical protein
MEFKKVYSNFKLNYFVDVFMFFTFARLYMMKILNNLICPIETLQPKDEFVYYC